MVSAAYYEKGMKKLYSGNITETDKKKAVKDTITILKQFGYDSGADFFEKIMSSDNTDDRK